MGVVAIFRGQEKIYSSGRINSLIINAVMGINEVAKNMYEDELMYYEMEGYSINCKVALNGDVILYYNENKKQIDMSSIYEAYSICMMYNDFNIMNSFIKQLLF